jgi:peptide-methionine (S)-S-oxide reductase
MEYSASLKKLYSILLMIIFSSTIYGCGNKNKSSNNNESEIKAMEENNINAAGSDTAIFGAGCFWCIEAVFQEIKGVLKVESGYSGGTVKNPSYREVCEGTTGHAEVARITFDPKVISYDELLSIFWQTHDPTTMNRQGNDSGTQYRSAIFYTSEKQQQLAEKYKKELNAQGAFANPIVTEIVPFKVFYKAEDYHQNYYSSNGNAPYCQFVIAPKVEKMRKVFKDKLKTAH